ncbi:MAG TPA: PDZ domain-containing protein, partial [Petrimonas sp.]|nr:PDZ domain-containing protein [Petrimonas sp.]
MKKLVALFSILATLMIVVSSCETKDPIVEKGTLQSATYNPATKSFTLTYSSGQTETVNAVVDDKTDPPTATATLKDGTVIYAGDAIVAGAATIAKEINIVSQFVYDGMSLYYFWADEVKNKKPIVADVNPENYFYKILNSTDTQHGWSWITDDINSLLSGFSGEATDAFGFQPFPLYTDDTYTTIVGFIRYVYPDSPADKAGLKRGEVITKINGQTITTNNYTLLYGANAETTFTVTDQYFKNPKNVKVMPANINTDPVLYSNFYENYNTSLYRVFSEFKTAGITDLVVDLRYNPGGGISAATYLASLIAPESNVRNKDVFTVMRYNSYVNGIFDKNKWDRRDYLGDYNNAKYQDPLNANLNLNKVYVIATGSSASASELITFCLEPFMQVEHIGEKTAGKYTASWT